MKRSSQNGTQRHASQDIFPERYVSSYSYRNSAKGRSFQTSSERVQSDMLLLLDQLDALNYNRKELGVIATSTVTDNGN